MCLCTAASSSPFTLAYSGTVLNSHATSGEPINDRLQQVLSPLGAIAEQDSHIAGIKRQWQEAGRPAGPALRAVLERVAALIRQVSTELQVIEEAVRARRDHLAAELDGCNRRCQMQRAYLRKS